VQLFQLFKKKGCNKLIIFGPGGGNRYLAFGGSGGEETLYQNHDLRKKIAVRSNCYNLMGRGEVFI